jgi:hypothetical protein
MKIRDVRQACPRKAGAGVSGTVELVGARGFRVDTHDGRIGSVAAVLPRAGREAAGVLLVHTGLLTCRLASVPFDQVEDVDAEARRILLRAEPDTMQEGVPSGARRRIVTRA